MVYFLGYCVLKNGYMEMLFLKIRQIWVCLKCWVMPQARASTRRQDIEKLGQAFTCWVMPQAQVSTRSGYHKLGASNGLWQGQYQKAGHHKPGLNAVHNTDIISLVPVMAYGRGSTRRQDIASLGYVQYIRQDIAKAWCHFW